MSGIIGKLSFDERETLARPALEQMLDAVSDRGTRGRAIYTAPGIALGWCADVARPTRGPIVAANELHQVRVVADSSLTNARELRKVLERLGHAFATRTDGELIAHAYEEWGDACVARLRGAFACAIWDERRRRLLLARDHAGARPLYFAILHGHGVVFASAIDALLVDPGVGREWSPEAIDAYLALGYVPAPLTVYRRVSKLEPAQRLLIDGRRFHVDQFWDLPQPETRWARSAAVAERLAPEIADTLASVLRGVIRRDTVDTAVSGTLYSGGAASAALLATGAARGGDVVMIALDQDPAEIAQGYDLARHFGCEPQVEVATPDVASVARQLASHFEEPIADPAAIQYYATCAAARLYTDEAFAGHGAAALWDGRAAGREPRADDDRRAIYTRTFAWEVRDANPFARHRDLYASRETTDPLDRAFYVDVRTSLPDNTLVIADRAARAAGMRLRFPFLDRDALELAAEVPAALKAPVGGRPVLRAVVDRHAPGALATRVRAAAPAWLRHALAAMVPSLLLAPRFDCRGIVSRPALRRLWHEHASGQRDHSRRFWSLLMLEFWFRQYIDGDAAEEPLEYAVLKAA